MGSELQNADRFLQLMSAKANGIKYASSFKEDLIAVKNAPLRFPKGIAPKKTPMVREDGDKQSDTSEVIDLKFKSIKPPFKFTVEFKTDSQKTIYEVKEILMKAAIAENSQLGDVIVAPSQFKLMLKSKVVHDSVSLLDLGIEKEYSFVVMTTKASEDLLEKSKKEKETTEKPVTNIEETTISQSSSKLVLTDQIWKKIHDAIRADFQVEDANIVVDRLKKGWELTE